MKNSNRIYFMLIIIIMILVSVNLGPYMSQVEQPKYQILRSEGAIEIRHYNPMIIAEVIVGGARGDAINNGFKLLAAYIFGENTLGTKISMTAPVQQQAQDKKWQIRFVMPTKYTLASLPKPKNPDIKINEINSKYYIAICFSGRSSDENLQKNTELLEEYIKANQIQIKSTAQYAFYNSPWTLPFLRRNEILIEIDHAK